MIKGLLFSTVLTALLFTSIFSLRVAAQEQPSAYQQADAFYQRSDFAKAASIYEQMARKPRFQKDTMVLRRLANSYMGTGHYQQSARYFGMLTQQPSALPDDWLHYGDMQMALGQYDSARIAYRNAGSSPKVAVRLAGCDSVQAWRNGPPSQASLENVRILNTDQPDWGATFYDSSEVVFVSDSTRKGVLLPGTKVNVRDDGRTDHDYTKLYVAKPHGDDYGYVEGFSGNMNHYLYHIGPVAFTQHFDTAFVTMTNPDKKITVEKISSQLYGRRRLGLYIFVRRNNEWRQLQAFAYNDLDNFSVGHAAINKSGDVLYFTSDRPGGQGGTDIWYSRKLSDTAWSAPQNCGNAVNTADDEAFPSVGPDGTLYFSSKGWAGMGGYDIYRATGSLNNWTSPINLHAPFNSSTDDFCFVVNEKGNGFLSSDRPGGKGDDDIYRFTVSTTSPAIAPVEPFKALMLEMTVLDYNTKAPAVGADALLKEPSKNRQWTEAVPANGVIYNAVDPGQPYTAQAYSANCQGEVQQLNTNLQPGDTIRVTLYTCGTAPAAGPREPQTILNGETLAVENIYYDLDKSNIRKDAATILDRLVDILKSHPNATVILSSYTDTRGSKAYNEALSSRRAGSVKAYLVKKGIAGKRVTSDHYGKNNLVNDCGDGKPCPESAHQANRRTTVTIKQ